MQASQPDRARRPARGVAALLAGVLLFVAVALAAAGGVGLYRRAQCGGESRPFLGSGRQAFAVYGCLAADAGPLIGWKKRLRLYDPTWKTVIK